MPCRAFRRLCRGKENTTCCRLGDLSRSEHHPDLRMRPRRNSSCTKAPTRPLQLSLSSCPCLSHMFWPNAAFSGRKNPVGIHGVFHGFVKTQQRVIVERVRLRHRFHESGMGAVLSPAVFGRHLDDLLEVLAILAVLLDIVLDRKTEKDQKTA